MDELFFFFKRLEEALIYKTVVGFLNFCFVLKVWF